MTRITGAWRYRYGLIELGGAVPNTSIHPSFSGEHQFQRALFSDGAWLTFTCGEFGTRAGLTVQCPRPGNQDIYMERARPARYGRGNGKVT